ncbi:MAG: C39 family peptidase [Caldilineaceae bacterium]|nr:C39 family peptidase [Caldilineaceae bacterium]
MGIRRGLGTPFSQIQHLHPLGVTVIYQEFGTLPEIYDLLCHGWPCIVGVQTQELPHWNKVNTQHAVVVVGMDQDHVYLNDPEFPAVPIQTPLGDFDLAWLGWHKMKSMRC